MKKTYIALLLSVFISLGGFIQAEDKTLFLTMESTTASVLENEISQQGNQVEFQVLNTNSIGLSVVKTKESHSPNVFSLIQEKVNPRGGYMAWTTYEKALAEIENPVYQPAYADQMAYEYTIDQQELVNQAINKVNSNNIVQTIKTLENFGTRYYTKQKWVHHTLMFWCKHPITVK